MKLGLNLNLNICKITGVPFNPDFGDIPDIGRNYASWTNWANNRRLQFESNSPSSRGTTYYFSQAGDDTTGDGSIGNPWQTRARAITETNAFSAGESADLRLRFRRGDTWNEDGNWPVACDDVTIDDYGSGDKPFFNAFTLQYNSGWTLSAGNRYRRAETNSIAWVRRKDDLGTPLYRVTSIADVFANENSWWWDGAQLHINIGENPNGVDVEAVVSNANNGVDFQGNGCRVQNIRADGYGLSATVTDTQTYAFRNSSAGDDANVFIGCEGYFSGSHVIAHLRPSGSGGKSMFIDCTAGYSQRNASGETLFNNILTNRRTRNMVC